MEISLSCFSKAYFCFLNFASSSWSVLPAVVFPTEEVVAFLMFSLTSVIMSWSLSYLLKALTLTLSSFS